MVTLEDFLGDVANTPRVTFTLKANNVVHSRVPDVPLDTPPGGFKWDTEARGTFDAYAEAKWYIVNKDSQPVVIDDTGANRSPEFILKNGDLDGDNDIDQDDEAIAQGALENSDPAKGDVNRDGKMEQADVDIIHKNLGSKGD